RLPPRAGGEGPDAPGPAGEAGPVSGARRGALRLLPLLFGVACGSPPSPAAAQADVASAPLPAPDSLRLTRMVTLEARDLRLRGALAAIAEQADIGLIYGNALVPGERRVTLRLRAVTAEEALRRVLAGTGLDFTVASPRQVVLVCRTVRCKQRM